MLRIISINTSSAYSGLTSKCPDVDWRRRVTHVVLMTVGFDMTGLPLPTTVSLSRQWLQPMGAYRCEAHMTAGSLSFSLLNFGKFFAHSAYAPSSALLSESLCAVNRASCGFGVAVPCLEDLLLLISRTALLCDLTSLALSPTLGWT